MQLGRAIRIFLADATVTGIRYAEVVNWTGQAIACPRNRLAELREWPEAHKPGVYLLFEARSGDEKLMAYVGESENVLARLANHDRDKEYWNEVVLFTSKDENLTKSHVKFLEASLVAMGRAADRYRLQNGNMPQQSSLPRADRAAMAEFTENIRIVLGTLGYPILEPLLTSSASPVGVRKEEMSAAASNSTELMMRVSGLVASGAQTDEGFVIRRGAQVAKGHSDSAAQRVVKLKAQLLADGRLKEVGDHLVLTEDVLVSSSSYAAVLVAGTSRSGPQSWYSLDGRSLKSLEDEAARIASVGLS